MKEPPLSIHDAPRKVIIGTCIFDTYQEKYPGVHKRIDALENLIKNATMTAKVKYENRRLDIFILPEESLGNKHTDSIESIAFRQDGPEVERFRSIARKYCCYLVVPFYSISSSGVLRNSALLIDRNGKDLGYYHKNHPVFSTEASGKPIRYENGVDPGTETPVFDCDFGRIGIQICFDMNYESGWKTLSDAGAELVVWPTESPQTILTSYKAYYYGYYIASSSFRCNAGIFDPAGGNFSRIETSGSFLVEEIDLSYAVLQWTATLRDGAAFSEKYGDKASFKYYEAEDRGIFWSNDPSIPIDVMIRNLGFERYGSYLSRLADALGDSVPFQYRPIL